MDENTVFGAENAENMPKKPSKKPLRDFFDVFEAVILAVVASLFIMTFLFKTGYVDGHSMDTTMADGDRYFVSDLFYTPARGDIIVFEPDLRAIDDNSDILYVKRIIAVAGDHLEIKSDDGENYRVYLNGQVLQEDYLDSFQQTRPADRALAGANTLTTDENGHPCVDITVPDGHVFVMGDNRLNSQDSRVIGCVDTRRIAGKVLLRFFPFDKFGKVS